MEKVYFRTQVVTHTQAGGASERKRAGAPMFPLRIIKNFSENGKKIKLPVEVGNWRMAINTKAPLIQTSHWVKVAGSSTTVMNSAENTTKSEASPSLTTTEMNSLVHCH